MKRLFLALVSFAALTATAAAADLPPRPAPQQYYKAPVVVPAYSWTGFYIGLNGGGGFGNSHWDALGSNFDISGGLVGGTIGYNYQAGQAVFGVEGDIDWADINGSTTSGCPTTCKTSDSWLSTVRGRLGYAADRFMPFVTGGVAFGDI
jgi:outer membrane immunogenic protein